MSDSPDSITDLAVHALREAGAVGVVPTPLDAVGGALQYGPPEDLFPPDVPAGLMAAVLRLAGKVLGAVALPERVLYLDRDQPPGRQRFHHGHELGHIAIPWHNEAYYGDDYWTLDPETRVQLEDEANRFSIALLFQGGGYAKEAADYRFGLATPLELSDRWGTSRHVAIRHYVQSHDRACAVLLIGRIPVLSRSGPAVKVLNGFESSKWARRYGRILDAVPWVLPVAEWDLAADALSAIQGLALDAVAEGEVAISLPEGARRLRYQVTSNTYNAFALLYEPHRMELGQRVRPVWTPPTAPRTMPHRLG